MNTKQTLDARQTVLEIAVMSYRDATWKVAGLCAELMETAKRADVGARLDFIEGMAALDSCEGDLIAALEAMRALVGGQRAADYRNGWYADADADGDGDGDGPDGATAGESLAVPAGDDAAAVALPAGANGPTLCAVIQFPRERAKRTRRSGAAQSRCASGLHS